MDSASIAALVVGFVTLLIVLVPLGLSPWLQAGLVVVGLGLAGLDQATSGGKVGFLLGNLLQELNPGYRLRLARHESGHLLVGYVLGLQAKDYALGAWNSYQKGIPGSSGIEFDLPEQINLRAYGTMLMAGGVAEVIYYDEALGGSDDVSKVRALLQFTPEREQREREYVRHATRILKANPECHDRLAQIMMTKAPLADCLKVLQSAVHVD